MGSSSLVFHYDEEILEALNAPDYPWDDMHHRSYFSPHDAFSPQNPSNQFSIETKDFLPPPQDMSIGSITLFPHLIPLKKIIWKIFNPPFIKVDIFVTPGVAKNILLGASCSLEEVAAYQSLF